MQVAPPQTAPPLILTTNVEGITTAPASIPTADSVPSPDLGQSSTSLEALIEEDASSAQMESVAAVTDLFATALPTMEQDIHPSVLDQPGARMDRNLNTTGRELVDLFEHESRQDSLDADERRTIEAMQEMDAEMLQEEEGGEEIMSSSSEPPLDRSEGVSWHHHASLRHAI